MTEQTVKNRGWVKNAAIIFLSVMLFLTFFSNTILNYSLPEVAGKYTMSGNIATSVRGSGTIEANMSYSVVIDETRQIKSVLVKQGDMIEAGQILFELEDAESDELKEAISTLSTMNYEYTKALMQAVPKNYAAENLELSNMREDLQELMNDRDAVALNKLALDQAKAGVKAAQKTVENLEKMISDTETEISQLTLEGNFTTQALMTKKEALDFAKTSLKTAQEDLTAAEENLAEVSKGSTSITELRNKITAQEEIISVLEIELANLRDDLTYMQNNKSAYVTAKGDYDKAVADLNKQQVLVDSLQQIYDNTKLQADLNNLNDALADLPDLQAEVDRTKAIVDNLPVATDENIRQTQRDIEAKNSELNTARRALDDLNDDYSDARESDTAIKKASREVDDAKAHFKNAQTVVSNLERDLGNALKEYKVIFQDNLVTLKDNLAMAKTALETAQEGQAEAEKKPIDQEAADDAIKTAQRSLEARLIAIAEQKADDNISEAISDLDMDLQKKKLSDQEARVEELKAKNTGTQITARYGGTLGAINCVAGDKVTAGQTLADIEVTEKGYTISFTVPQEQARKVRVGDRATVTGWWWGDALNITLVNIKNDPASGGKSKVLVFEVLGDVTVGQTLNLSVGERSTYYDVIVPNSAIREDSNGTFVLMAAAKSTPIGTRYIATRVDVTVLAKDDTNSAVNGALYGYGEYIITTSTKPIDIGSQVRLVDQ